MPKGKIAATQSTHVADHNKKGKEKAVPVVSTTIARCNNKDKEKTIANFSKFMATYEDSTYQIGNSLTELYLQLKKLSLEAHMQVYVNFIYHPEKLPQNNSDATAASSISNNTPVPLIFKDALVLLLNQLYLLRRDTLLKLTEKISQRIGFFPELMLQELISRSVEKENLPAQLDLQCHQFEDLIKTYFLADDFSGLITLLHNPFLYIGYREKLLKKKKKLKSAKHDGNTAKAKKLEKELGQLFYVYLECFTKKILENFLQFLNRNNPIYIATKLAQLQNNQKEFEQACEVYKQYFPVNDLIHLRKNYIEAYQHYLTIMDEMNKLLNDVGLDSFAFNHYITQVNSAIMGNYQTYLHALLVELKNQHIRLDLTPTTNHEMRAWLDNNLNLYIEFVFIYYRENYLPDKNITLNAYLYDNMQATTQLSIMVLQAQNRFFFTGYAKTQAELEEPSHSPWLALDYQNSPPLNDSEETVEEHEQPTPQEKAELQPAAPIPPTLERYPQDIKVAQKSKEKEKEENKQSPQGQEELIKKHQAELKKATKAQQAHALQIESFIQQELNAKQIDTTKIYQKIHSYWKNRGHVGGLFSRRRQAKQMPYYCIDENIQEDMQNHTRAKELFNQQLESASTVAEIAALWKAAEPYINRHRNDFWDIIVGKNHTNSWRTAMSRARTKAYKLLKAEVDNILNIAERKNNYQQWLNHPLFAEHRRDCILLGAWGNTRTKAKIQSKINACEKEFKKVSLNM